jgi:hypothetical protein
MIPSDFTSFAFAASKAASRAGLSFKLVSVMSVIEIKEEMFISRHMNNDGRNIGDVKVEIFEIFESVSEALNFVE